MPPVSHAELRLRLDKLLGPERVASFHATPPPAAAKDAWYRDSYPMFLAYFAGTRGVTAADEVKFRETWVARKALVFSWIARIPDSGVDLAAAAELARLEEALADCALADIGFPGIQVALHASDPGFPLRHLLERANVLLNSAGGATPNLATATKLLHFMLPNLVPIFDGNVAATLFGASQAPPSMGQYTAYVRALQEFVGDDERGAPVIAGAHKAGVPVIRLVDSMLFRAAPEGVTTP